VSGEQSETDPSQKMTPQKLPFDFSRYLFDLLLYGNTQIKLIF